MTGTLLLYRLTRIAEEFTRFAASTNCHSLPTSIVSIERGATDYSHDRPGVYAIYVAGRLDADWSSCLGGMSITYSVGDDADGAPVTILSGCLPDQAALFGVLNTLYNARFPLLFVKYLWPGKAVQ